MIICQLGGAFHQSLFINDLVEAQLVVECIDNIPSNFGHIVAQKNFDCSITDTQNLSKYLDQKDDSYIISSYGSDIAELARLNLLNSNCSSMSLLTKYSARLLLREIFPDQPQPEIYLVNDITDEFLKKSSNYYVKPNISSGSKGVVCLNDMSYACSKQSILNAQQISLDDKAVIETVIPNNGFKYYCEGIKCGNSILLTIGVSLSSNKNLVWDGSIQIQESNSRKYCVVDYNQVINKLKDVVWVISSAIDRVSFPFNIDFFLHPSSEEPIILEFAPRAGGNFLHVALEHIHKLDYARTYLSIYDEQKVPTLYYRESPRFANISSDMPLRIQIHKNRCSFTHNYRRLETKRFNLFPLNYSSSDPCVIFSNE